MAHQNKNTTNYTCYKQALREEFLYTCVYCGTREPELGGAQSFGIDHYKPKSKFQHLIATYSNLLYACRNCNSYKGNYWPTHIQKLLRQVILNPRKDKFNTHIDQSDHKWLGKTLRGKWNILKLRLDSSALIHRRKDRSSIEKAISKLEKILGDYKTNLNTTKLSADKNPEILKIELEIIDLAEQINALKRKIIGSMD